MLRGCGHPPARLGSKAVGFEGDRRGVDTEPAQMTDGVAARREVAAALEGDTGASDLEILLTRRERQVLHVLRTSRYPLRPRQVAALIWSDPHRTHDVRSALYRLRTKLRGSGWAIPFPEKGGGIRLVRLADETGQSTPKPIDDKLEIRRVSPDSAAA